MDVLYGGGTRYEQQAHGRGSYGQQRPGFSLRTREERYPELWDRYPEIAQQLYTTPQLPWQTWEAACKMLRGARIPLPPVGDKMLAGFLAAASPLLRAVAAQQIVATLDAGRRVSADAVASAYLSGTREQRRHIARFLASHGSDPAWTAAFATRLCRLAGYIVQDNNLPRKAALAFALLVSHFPALIRPNVSAPIAIALYSSGRAEFQEWALAVFRDLLPADLPQWLFHLQVLPEKRREAAVQAVVAGCAKQEIPHDVLWELVENPDEWVRQTGWRILAQSRTSMADITHAWTRIMDSGRPTEALLTAFASPDALLLFERCAFDSDQMAVRMQVRPYLIPLLPMAVLQKVVAILPPTAVVRLISEASELQWPGLRAAILLDFLPAERRMGFWHAAFAAIGATGSAQLTQRLLEDATMQAAFLQLADIGELLVSANPAFGPILGRWAEAHTGLLSRDSADLLRVATHPLPEIRAVGLDRARRIGFSLPFALRLLESEVPQPVGLGKAFFEAIGPGDSLRTEAITALCDSPKPSVRAYGRDYLVARPEMIADTDVLDRLSENPDAETQAFVAGKLLSQPVTEPGRTLAFDRAVLRTRDRGRRAKELVKARLTEQTTPDIALLLEMARSRTPRDADWALGQLAKLALDGVEIPGFTLDGVAGG